MHSMKDKVTILLLIFLFSLFSNQTYAKHLLIYGDSLSAAYGMQLEQGWVALLQQDLQPEHKISNASISGETSGGGLARLPITLEELNPNIVLIALGANDGLRGFSTKQLEKNLSDMVDLIKQAGATPVIAGISIPPSYGPRYIDQLRSVFPQVAEQNQINFIDLFREDFLRTPGYMQDDDLHPTAITQPIVKDMVKAFLLEQNILDN